MNVSKVASASCNNNAYTCSTCLANNCRNSIHVAASAEIAIVKSGTRPVEQIDNTLKAATAIVSGQLIDKVGLQQLRDRAELAAKVDREWVGRETVSKSSINKVLFI